MWPRFRRLQAGLAEEDRLEASGDTGFDKNSSQTDLPVRIANIELVMPALLDMSRQSDAREVLHLVSRSCTLVTHQHSAAGVWDGDDQTLVRPVFQKDDLDFTHAVDAMYLEDGELYTLVRCGRLSDEIYFIQLWCGVPGRAVGRFSLPGRWLNESVRIEFSPEGEFVIASSMGTILMWRTLTGEEIQRADCAHWGGSIKSMVLRLAVLFQGDPEGSGIFNRPGEGQLGWKVLSQRFCWQTFSIFLRQF